MTNSLLRMWRRCYRIPLIFLWGTLQALYFIPFILPRKERVRLMARQSRSWGKGLVKLFGLDLRIHGNIDRYKEHGGLLVSNHLGYLDIFVHASLCGFRFAAKKEIRSWPVFGQYVAMAQAIWVDRTSPAKSKETLKQFRETLKQKIPLIVYPEGTSSDGRSGLLPFKSTSFEAIAGTDIPIQPILTFYRWNEEKDINPAWYGDIGFGTHFWQVLGNGKVICDVYLLDLYYAPEGADRKQVMNEVREIMEQEYRQRLPEILGERKEMV
ncbi:MAG: 1-acyl-sn-glycerol-3-phosphate acyltransferase [Lentisphaeria bacterium]|nr:1-acyl-sn-glycerol-3-phosphate acyltransferase [Lentisphaeria bacterium]